MGKETLLKNRKKWPKNSSKNKRKVYNYMQYQKSNMPIQSYRSHVTWPVLCFGQCFQAIDSRTEFQVCRAPSALKLIAAVTLVMNAEK